MKCADKMNLIRKIEEHGTMETRKKVFIQLGNALKVQLRLSPFLAQQEAEISSFIVSVVVNP